MPRGRAAEKGKKGALLRPFLFFISLHENLRDHSNARQRLNRTHSQHAAVNW